MYVNKQTTGTNVPMIKCPDSSVSETEPQCQFFVVRKKRLCRMTVRPGRQYCGEHEPEPKLESGQADTRIPCPNDPKHTCYASKLEKHLAVCNARAVPQPAYIVPRVNAPAVTPRARRLLADAPAALLLGLVQKVNLLYDKYVKDQISSAAEHPIHPLVAPEFAEEGRTESSRRHLRQASSLLWLAEDVGLVRDDTCYVELGAGKGQLAYYAGRAWCGAARGSRVLLLDRAAPRHKRDNKLRGRDQQPPECAGATRLRADLAHVALGAVPAAQTARHVVGLAKHLCGVATDYALRCVTSEQLGAKTRGLVLATCCHHRCQREAFCGMELLTEMGITESEMDIMFGIVSWGTCGDGRSRADRTRDQHAGDTQKENAGDTQDQNAEDTQQQNEVEEPPMRAAQQLSAAARAAAGRRAKALLDCARARWLRRRGLRARLVRFVPETVSPENLAIVAVRDT